MQNELEEGKKERDAAAAEGEGQARDVWTARETTRGYRGLYERHVNQAHLGCDFDFLTADGPGGKRWQ